METKRIFTAVLAALMLATTLASCSRRDQFRPPETDKPTGEQTTAAGQPDGSNPNESNLADTNQSGGDMTDPGNTTPPDVPIVTPPVSGDENGKITGNPYEGWTAEELYASFMEDQERSVFNNLDYGFGNTPYYVILDVQYGGSMFSKLTGQVVQICKDPICDHNGCIFSHLTTRMIACQVVNDRCYLAVEGYKGDVYTCNLYSFDLLMNDPQLVCEWEEMDCPDTIYVYQGKIYYDADIKFDGGQYSNVTMVYDINKKTTAPLHNDPVRCSMIVYEGSYEWYTAWEDGSLRRYNLDTGVDEVILTASHLDREAGETEFIFWAESNQMVYVQKRLANQDFSNILKYDMSTGEMLDTGFGNFILYDDRVYISINHYVEENKNDPHYEYYAHDSFSTRDGGKIYQKETNTGEMKALVRLCTDGIPDAMKSRLFMDGHFLMIQYQTYKDFNNCYSPTLPGWATSKRYVVVNLETGGAYDLGVDLSTQSVHKQ